jgi:hypothetical protein
MENNNLEKNLKKVRVPSIVSSGHKTNLRRALLNSSKFENNKSQTCLINFNFMKKIKLSILAGVLALVIIFALAFNMLISPQMKVAQAMEIMQNDPRVNAVIEEYNLQVEEVEVVGNVAYIFLYIEKDGIEVTLTVDLESGTVGKIVSENGEIKAGEINYDDEDNAFEKKAEAMGLSEEELKTKMILEYKVKAEKMGMTAEEFKAHLDNEKKEWDNKSVEEKAEIKGMTVEEYEAAIQNK